METFQNLKDIISTPKPLRGGTVQIGYNNIDNLMEFELLDENSNDGYFMDRICHYQCYVPQILIDQVNNTPLNPFMEQKEGESEIVMQLPYYQDDEIRSEIQRKQQQIQQINQLINKQQEDIYEICNVSSHDRRETPVRRVEQRQVTKKLTEFTKVNKKQQILRKQKINLRKNSQKIVKCNCKKSNCQKQYCACFQSGVGCNNECQCVNCRNQPLEELDSESTYESDHLTKDLSVFY